MKDNSLAMAYGLARKDGLGTEDNLAMEHVWTIMDDELAMTDRLLSQGRRTAATAVSVARELPARLCTHRSGRAGKGSSVRGYLEQSHHTQKHLYARP